MRPLRLELQGFSAFRDNTVVDFTGVDVVAFVGPTGSGKSSIIDGMTFALYGSVARYGKNDVAPIIHGLATEARVRLDFESAGRAYTVVRVVRRVKGGATTKEARLQRGDDVLASDARAVAARCRGDLGLDFERFNKTVVLPQGRFAEFLHDTPAQRQQLLRDLLGFGMYERIGQRARLMAKEADQTAQILARQIDDSIDLSDERGESLRVRSAEIAAARSSVGARIEDLGRLRSASGEVRAALDVLDGRLDIVASIHVPDLTVLGEEVAQSEEAVERSRVRLERSRRAADDADAAARRGPSIGACEAALALHQRRAAKSEQRGTVASDLDRARDAHRTATQAVAAVTARLDGLRATVADVDRALREIERAVDAHPDRGSIERTLELHRLVDVATLELAAAELALDAASTRADTARSAADLADEHLHRLLQLEPAAALAGELHTGEPCPVCEQIVRRLPAPRLFADHDIEGSRRDAESARQLAQDATSDAIRAATTIDAHRSTLGSLARQLAGASDADHAAEQLAELDRLQGAHAAARASARDAGAALSDAEANLGVENVLAIERQAERTVIGLEATIAQIDTDLVDLAAALADVDAVHAVQEALVLARTLESDRSATAQAASAARVENDHATARLAALRERVAAVNAEFNAARDRVGELGPPPISGDPIADWQVLAEWSVETADALVARRGDLEAELERLAHQIAETSAEIDAIARPHLDPMPTDLGELRERFAAAEAGAAAAIERFREARARDRSLQTEIASSRDEAAVSGLVGDLLRSSRFERWLLEEAIGDLVDRATVRLRELTSGQYSLVASDGAFRVCDHRNADEVRDARSLSGGETFLASLSLALALADSAMDMSAEGTAPLESIFLDEGFGTLDPDTLDIVADTIEELGAAGRLVGVVTHIRELAERMPVRFEVHKGPTSSTVVRQDL